MSVGKESSKLIDEVKVAAGNAMGAVEEARKAVAEAQSSVEEGVRKAKNDEESLNAWMAQREGIWSADDQNFHDTFQKKLRDSKEALEEKKVALKGRQAALNELLQLEGLKEDAEYDLNVSENAAENSKNGEFRDEKINPSKKVNKTIHLGKLCVWYLCYVVTASLLGRPINVGKLSLSVLRCICWYRGSIDGRRDRELQTG
jgi:hypothetical protein